jgi:hypothetical protein
MIPIDRGKGGIPHSYQKVHRISRTGNDARPVCEQLRSIAEMPMKSKTEAKKMSQKKTAKKKTTAAKTATPPKALPAGLHKKQGIWVFSTGQSITAAQMERLRQSIYLERENSFLGNLAKPKAKNR